MTATPESAAAYAAYAAGWAAGSSGLPTTPPRYLDNPTLRQRFTFGWWDGISGNQPQPDRTEYHLRQEEP